MGNTEATMDSVLQQDRSIRAGEMAQRVKAVAAEPDDLSSVSRPHRVEGESGLLQAVL